MPLFNTELESVLNYIINQAKTLDIWLNPIKLQQTLFFLDGWSLSEFNTELCNFGDSHFRFGKYSIYQDDIVDYYRMPNIGQRITGEIISYDHETFKLITYPELNSHMINKSSKYINSNNILSDLKAETRCLLMLNMSENIQTYMKNICNDFQIDSILYKEMPIITSNQIRDAFEQNKQYIKENATSKLTELNSVVKTGIAIQLMHSDEKNKILQHIDSFVKENNLNNNQRIKLNKLISQAFLTGKMEYDAYQEMIDDNEDCY